MKRKELEILLQKVPAFDAPDASLEQYPTPACIATEIVFGAYAAGDIEGMKVMDLGCGTGIFSVAAALMGAETVVGYDISGTALEQARRYARSIGLDIDLKLSDIKDVHENADTILMNPPFGSQKKHADRPFLKKALESADKVYSIHMADTLDFLKKYAASEGRCLQSYKIYKYAIPHTFSFHTKAKQTVEIAAVVFS